MPAPGAGGVGVGGRGEQRRPYQLEGRGGDGGEEKEGDEEEG